MNKVQKPNGVIFDTFSVIAKAFTASGSTLTASSHGFTSGDRVVLTTSGTLPAGLSLKTTYFVKVLTANTFELHLVETLDDAKTTTDGGSGTHTATTGIGNPVSLEGFINNALNLYTTGTATLTLTYYISNDINCPDFNADSVLAADPATSNHYSTVQIKSLVDQSAENGTEAISADLNIIYAINKNIARWFCIKITSYTQGVVHATITNSNNS